MYTLLTEQSLHAVMRERQRYAEVANRSTRLVRVHRSTKKAQEASHRARAARLALR